MTHLRPTTETIFAKPQIMGILNVTPDSFYDGGLWLNKEKAVRHAVAMVAEGASIIDVGGESTRPGAQAVSLHEELDRVIPIVELLAAEVDATISIDTYKPQVMHQAVQVGATMVNDVKALTEPGALEVVGQAQVKVCLMHMLGQPDFMQDSPAYFRDVIIEIKNFFAERIGQCLEFGISKENIIVDPGIGFGKKLIHNMRIINQLASFSSLGVEILIGSSRKFSIGEILQKPATERLMGSLALATLAANNGATYIRTHDVKATCEALTILWAVRNETEIISL